MKCKKLLAGLLSAAMVFGSVSFTAFAEDSTTMTFDEFVARIENGESVGTDDGRITVKWSPESGCYDTRENHTCTVNNVKATASTPRRENDNMAQYQFAKGVNDIDIKNVDFEFVAADFTICANSWHGSYTADTIKTAQLHMYNTGNVTITGCTFDNVVVTPWNFENTAKPGRAVDVENCTFKNIPGSYGLKDVQASNIKIIGNTFDNTRSGIMLSGATAKNVLIDNNTFNCDDSLGGDLIQIASSFAFDKNSSVAIVNNTSTSNTPVLRVLNADMTNLIYANNDIPADAPLLKEDTPTTIRDSINDKLLAPVAKVGDKYYTDFTSAYDAANAMTEPAVIDCLADNIVTNKGRYAIMNDITINGNGATIKKSDNLNASVEFATEESNAGLNNFTKETTLKINELNNVAVWGYRRTNEVFNVSLNACKDVDRIYITGTDGVTNICVDDCTFTKYDSANNDSGIYANNPGELVVTNSTFKTVPIALNINFKAAGERNITVSNCTFIDCGEPSNTNNPSYAAPIRFVTTQQDGKINAEVANCEITNADPSKKTHGDILLGDGRTGKDSTTNVTVKVENNNSDLKVVNEYPDETPSTSKDVPAGTSATVTNVVVANTIDLKFDKKTDNEYDIVLSGNGKNINRLNAAEFKFVLDTEDKLTYEIKTADGLAAIEPADDNGKYVFYFDGKDNFDNTQADIAESITIGTVVFDGYGEFKFYAESGRATATTTADNLVTEFVTTSETGKGTLNIKKNENQITDGKITVPTQTLTINVAMNHKVTDNAADYQDMTVEISGGDLGKDTKVFKLGTDGTKLVDGVYKIETDLTQNRLYTVTVKGAGYRTARYTVNMSADKTMNFWNNVMTSDVTVVDDMSAKKNFLAGDIVKDGVINIYDLSAVVAYFGNNMNTTAADKYAKYDINRDGKIDMMDISIVLTSWGE